MVLLDPATDDCPIYLQVLFRPMRTPCNHVLCEQCWKQVTQSVTASEESCVGAATCPVCRAAVATARLDPALDNALCIRHPETWHARLRQCTTDQVLEQRNQKMVEQESSAAAEAVAEAEEADEMITQGRMTRRMTTGLVHRCASIQPEYRTLTLASKLELTLLGLRNISPVLSQYTSLKSLRLEHNAIGELIGLELPLLKVCSACRS